MELLMAGTHCAGLITGAQGLLFFLLCLLFFLQCILFCYNISFYCAFFCCSSALHIYFSYAFFSFSSAFFSLEISFNCFLASLAWLTRSLDLVVLSSAMKLSFLLLPCLSAHMCLSLIVGNELDVASCHYLTRNCVTSSGVSEVVAWWRIDIHVPYFRFRLGFHQRWKCQTSFSEESHRWDSLDAATDVVCV